MTELSAPKPQIVRLMAIGGVLTVVVLTAVGILRYGPVIETDLLQRTRQALSEASLPTDSIQFSGRDGELSGTAESKAQAQRMLEIAATIEGVRAVSSHLAVVAASPTPPATMPQTQPLFTKGLYIPPKKHPIEQLNLSGVQFGYARSELSDSAKSTLDPAIALLRQNANLTVEVSAHTENQGTAIGNMAVTQARATAVRNYMLSQGIKPERVQARGYGSTRPLADNSTDTGQALNRRVEITVLSE